MALAISAKLSKATLTAYTCSVTGQRACRVGSVVQLTGEMNVLTYISNTAPDADTHAHASVQHLQTKCN